MARLPDEKINVGIEVRYHADGQVSLTFGPIAPQDVPDLLSNVGTAEFAEQFVAGLAAKMQELRDQ